MAAFGKVSIFMTYLIWHLTFERYLFIIKSLEMIRLFKINIYSKSSAWRWPHLQVEVNHFWQWGESLLAATLQDEVNHLWQSLWKSHTYSGACENISLGLRMCYINDLIYIYPIYFLWLWNSLCCHKNKNPYQSCRNPRISGLKSRVQWKKTFPRNPWSRGQTQRSGWF